MSNQDEPAAQGAGTGTPEKPSWTKRYGTELIIVVFFVLTASIVAYEMLGR